ALGELGNVTILPGQIGSGDEGTAMLEVIHDLAPGAQLYFATAVEGIGSFARNIRNLRAAGCDIIVDDVPYSNETPFQDGQAPAIISNTKTTIPKNIFLGVLLNGKGQTWADDLTFEVVDRNIAVTNKGSAQLSSARL